MGRTQGGVSESFTNTVSNYFRTKCTYEGGDDTAADQKCGVEGERLE